MEKEIITHAAIRLRREGEEKTYSLPAPNRHHDVLKLIPQELRNQVYESRVEGFCTSHDRFVDRHEAAVVAIRAGQSLDRAPTATHWKHGLFSEDVW